MDQDCPRIAEKTSRIKAPNMRRCDDRDVVALKMDGIGLRETLQETPYLMGKSTVSGGLRFFLKPIH